MYQGTKKNNSHGNSLLDLCKSSQLRIVNGRVKADATVGEYTCVNPNGSSVVDYILCTANDFQLIHDFDVGIPTLYSDHNIIAVKIICNDSEYASLDNCTANSKDYKLKWNDVDKDLYINQISSEETEEKIVEMFNDVGNCRESVEMLVNNFTSLIGDIANPLFGKNIKINYNKGSVKKASWMSNECLRLRDDFLLCLNIYRTGQCDQNRINMVTARSAYVNCARKCRKEYDECQMNNLLQKQHVDAKAFWHLLRSNINVDKTPQLKACDFFSVF